MNEHIKIIYEVMGTEWAPSPQRESFLELLTHYQNALKKRAFMRETIEQIRHFFEQYPTIINFSFRVQYDKREQYVYIENIEYQTVDNSKDNSTELNIRNFLIFYLEEEINLFLSKISRERDGDIVFTKTMHEDFFEGFLSKEEVAAFNSINFYEKNLLEQSIAKNSKTSLYNKI